MPARPDATKPSKKDASHAHTSQTTSSFWTRPLTAIVLGAITSYLLFRFYPSFTFQSIASSLLASRQHLQQREQPPQPPKEAIEFTVATDDTSPAPQTRVCLNMIVRDEETEIINFLQSVKPHIVGFFICDTGSVDTTPTLVTDFFRTTAPLVPGVLEFHQWKNFAHNRNHCLQKARERMGDVCAYWLILEPDHVVVSEGGVTLPSLSLTHTSYYLQERSGKTVYSNKRLVSTKLPWKYVGAVHEYITLPEEAEGGETTGTLPPGIFVFHNIVYSKEKYERYRDLLEADMMENPQNPRTRFYLGQTYRNLKQIDEALQQWSARIQLGGWPEEVYMSAYDIGNYLYALYKERKSISEETRISLAPWISLPSVSISLADVVRAYKAAASALPYRKEAMYKIAKLYRTELEDFEGCFRFAERAHTRGPHTTRTLFEDKTIVEYQIDDELCVCGFYSGERGREEGARACARLEQTLAARVQGGDASLEKLLNRTRKNAKFYASATTATTSGTDQSSG